MECYDRKSSSGDQTDGNGGETKIYMGNKLSILVKKKDVSSILSFKRISFSSTTL